MNILQITAYIITGLIGCIVIKFIYQNFFKPLERKEPEAKENIEEKQPEKPIEISPLEFIKNDKRSEGIDIEFIEETIKDFQYCFYRLRTNKELLNAVIEQWDLKLEREAFEQNVINTGRYNTGNGKTDIYFHNVTSIINVEETLCFTKQSGYPARTIIVYGELMCEINLIQELPTLFNKWKMKQENLI